MRRLLLSTWVIAAMMVIPATAQTKVERNVVYGMHSGLALLMDVYHSDRPNGRGIVCIPGSGWNMPLGYDAVPLKDRPAVAGWRALTQSGYTLFVINHRATPAFQYPAPVEDAQRAVRFVRANARRFGVSADHIGALGASSGGHLAAMLGTLDGKGDQDDADAVNRFSAKVQSVVAIYGAFDLKGIPTVLGGPAVALFVGARPVRGSAPPNSADVRRFVAASPITYVTGDDAPFLLFHGDADETVPFDQSRLMDEVLKKAGVAVTFVPVPGGGHGENFLLKPGDPRLPDVIGQAAKWFDKHLRQDSRTSSR
jgi:acetyl esterase/lipase